MNNACCVCGSTKNISLEITMSQLIFGGFRGPMHAYYCKKCEAKKEKAVIKVLERVLKDSSSSYLP